MQTSWQTFLNQLGAQRNAQNIVERFHGDDEPALMIGDHLSIIQVRGEETEQFLQGQLTCDMREVFAGQTRLAMHLSLKGRGMTSMRVMPAHNGVDLIVPRNLAEDSLMALQKYALFSKVTLTLDAQRVPLLFTSKAGKDLLNAYAIPLPGQPGEATFAKHTNIAQLENKPRYLLLLDHPHAQKILEKIPVADIGAAHQWQLSDIRAGIGQVQPGSRDLWLPQVLNYDLLNGINFNKGCYLGQEVVARMHFKGSLKQRMRRLSWQPSISAHPGDILRNEKGSAVGEVVSAVQTNSTTEALAVLRHDHDGALFIEKKPLKHTIGELPYRLP